MTNLIEFVFKLKLIYFSLYFKYLWRMIMADSGDGFFKGFVIGSIIGGIAGLLLAPKSGKEIREDLSEEAGKILDYSKSDFEHARKAAMKSYEEGRDKIIDKMTKNEVAEEPDQEEEKPKKKSRKPKSKTE
jgi:gas vesicle protein